MLHFRGLGASFSSFGCFVFEIWVLVFRASVFVFETTVLQMLSFNSGQENKMYIFVSLYLVVFLSMFIPF